MQVNTITAMRNKQTRFYTAKKILKKTPKNLISNILYDKPQNIQNRYETET